MIAAYETESLRTQVEILEYHLNRAERRIRNLEREVQEFRALHSMGQFHFHNAPLHDPPAPPREIPHE